MCEAAISPSRRLSVYKERRERKNWIFIYINRSKAPAAAAAHNNIIIIEPRDFLSAFIVLSCSSRAIGRTAADCLEGGFHLRTHKANAHSRHKNTDAHYANGHFSVYIRDWQIEFYLLY